MINIQLIRNQQDEVRDAMRRRSEDAPLDRIAELDTARRSTIVKADELRAYRNEVKPPDEGAGRPKTGRKFVRDDSPAVRERL